MEPYRVNLDVYNGPLDLLLYLIRRDEVDIYDIPVARITEQYCSYVDVINELNPNMAGDFLVMASTLLEIKSRMLLPRPESSDDGGEEDSGDPRAELVRQLLQYKAFKDAADRLDAAGQLASMQHPRKPVTPEFEAPELDMENVHIWDLLEAFNAIMASVGVRKSFHQVIFDDTPISLYAEDIVDRLGREGNLRFSEIFKGRESRSEITGLFLAMLELIRQKRIRIQQERNFGEIYVSQSQPLDDENLEPEQAVQDEQAAGAEELVEETDALLNAGETSSGASDSPQCETMAQVGETGGDGAIASDTVQDEEDDDEFNDETL